MDQKCCPDPGDEVELLHVDVVLCLEPEAQTSGATSPCSKATKRRSLTFTEHFIVVTVLSDHVLIAVSHASTRHFGG